MLNHASMINRKRVEARIKKNRETGQGSLQDEIADMPMIGGRRLTELTSEELLAAHEEVDARIIKVKKPDAES